jgi:hypothetical protein
MCDDSEVEKKWAEAIYEDVEFRNKLMQDLEIQHFCNGTFRFNAKIADEFVNFLKTEAEEHDNFEEDSSEEARISATIGVVHRLFDLIAESQKHLLVFSDN